MQVDYYRMCVLPLLKKFLPDNELELKVMVGAYNLIVLHVGMKCLGTSLTSDVYIFINIWHSTPDCSSRGVARG